jgi:hypothetical protein
MKPTRRWINFESTATKWKNTEKSAPRPRPLGIWPKRKIAPPSGLRQNARWWPYVFSQQTRLRVGDDGKVTIGQQRFSIDTPPRSKVIRCLHPKGDVTVLKGPPTKNAMLIVLLSSLLC